MSPKPRRSLRFVDLFAGLGGFHLAMKRLGHECVFACEIDKSLADVYKKNHGLKPSGDIRAIEPKDIPEHDVLCAGFPCQPFSKAGEQLGFDCPKNGDLFSYVLRIIAYHQPTYLLLENVPNLKRHNNGGTWQDLVARLKDLGYNVQAERLSPHDFGIPQIRERIFIVGSLESLDKFEWPQQKEDATLSIESVLDKRPKGARPLSPQVLKCLSAWKEFVTAMPSTVDFPSAPLWSMEFGATYPYEDTTPFALGVDALRAYRGSHGMPLRDVPSTGIMSFLPSYAVTKKQDELFPDWKIRFIRQNREFYAENKKWIDPWLPKLAEFPPSLQKLEWNCKGDKRDIWSYVIQFRASGVRVKRRTTAPSLVAMTTTQVPIIAWEKRYMTVRECARLQSMAGLKHLPKATEAAYSALGNAVNVQVAKRVASALLDSPLSKRPRSRSADPQRALRSTSHRR